MKTCTDCKVDKELSEFHFRNDQNKYRLDCKECHRRKNREYNIRIGKNSFKLINIKKLLDDGCKKCSRCNTIKKLEEFYNHTGKIGGKQSHCINCEKINKNKEYYKNYTLKRLKEDSSFNFKFKVRNLIRSSFKRNKNYYLKSTSTESILGCNIDEFKNYIYSKFKNGMSFENYGNWHLDHIIPLSQAKTQEEIIRLNHYTNFQPLWAEDNFKKSNKIIEQQLILI